MEGQQISSGVQSRGSYLPESEAHSKRTLHHRLEDIIHLAASLNDAVTDLTRSSLPPLTEDFDFYNEVRRFESSLIKGALRLTGGSQAKAAKLLKLKATTLNAKMKTLKLNSRGLDAQ